jgi:hypothetical protein
LGALLQIALPDKGEET